MAKTEIHYHNGNIRDYLWWRFMPGITVTVLWPRGQVEVGPNSRQWDGVMHGGIYQMVESADPNDHYRPWLEENVGKQRWDWDWKVGPDMERKNSNGSVGSLIIKIRKKKAVWATMAALRWA